MANKRKVDPFRPVEDDPGLEAFNEDLVGKKRLKRIPYC